MSAFMVCQQTINEITYAIKNDADENQGFFATMNAPQLARKLAAMNAEALEQRYHGDYPVDIDAYTYKPERQDDMIQLYKSISCFQYQCYEGNVPECELYKHVEYYQAKLANSIIYGLPEFEKAEWR